MRSTIFNFLAAALVVFGTTVAGASSFTVSQIGTTCVGPCVAGDTVDLELSIDASDLVGTVPGATFGYGVSILIGGDAVWGTLKIADGGVGAQNAGQFRVNFGGPPPAEVIAGGLPLASAVEPNNDINPTIVTMASFFSFSAVSGALVDYTNGFDTNFVARVTLQLLEPGLDTTVFLAGGAGTGDGFDLDGVNILPSFSSNLLGIDIVPIPEPGTALLMVLGLIGLSAAGSRREA